MGTEGWAKYTKKGKEEILKEAGTISKKRNYVIYESKLGTKKEKILKIFRKVVNPKLKQVEARKEDKIFKQRKNFKF